MQIITLTTDFGSQDWFVGTMKGVILGLNPEASVVDICHEIPPADIRAGAFALMASYRFFPRGTVHMAVVDPGVGGRRSTIAVQTANYFFVGPDNGVLSFALKNEEIKEIRRLNNPEYFLKPVSHTFHGRDIFAPMAAQLSRGVAICKLGSEPDEPIVSLPWPEPEYSQEWIRGEVIYVDRFGNAITNISYARIGVVQPPVFSRARKICVIKPYYDSVPAGQAVAVPGSTGFVEIALNGDSAAKSLGLKIGDPISVDWRLNPGD